MNEKTMTFIRSFFVEQGYALANWRIKYLGYELIRDAYGNRSDWIWIHVEVYKYRCRKPCISWHLAYNYVRKVIDMEKSKFVNL